MADGFTLTEAELEELFHPSVKDAKVIPPVILEGTSYFKYIEGDYWYTNTDMWNQYVSAWGVNISTWKKPGTNSSSPDYQYHPDVVERNNTYVNRRPDFNSSTDNGSWSLKYSDRTYGLNKSIGDYSAYNSYYDAKSRSRKLGNRDITDWSGTSSIGKILNGTAISAGILGVSAVDYLMGGKFGLANSFGMTDTFNNLWDTGSKVYDSVTGLFSAKGAGSDLLKSVKGITGGSIEDSLKNQTGNDLGRTRNAVSKFADSISIRGPDDSLITKDAYGLTPSIINNSVKSNAKYDIKSLISRLGADGEGVADSLGGIKEGMKEAGDRIHDAMRAVSDVTGIIQSVQNKSINQLLDMVSGNVPILGEIADGIRIGSNLYESVRGTSWNDLASIIRAGDRVIGTNLTRDFIDAQSSLAVLSSLMEESMYNGNNGGVNFLINTIKDNLHNPDLNTQNYLDNLAYPISQQYAIAAVQGNLDLMYSTMEFVNAEEVIRTSPYIITDLFRSYRLPKNCTYSVLIDELHKMIAVCGNLDPHWEYTTIGPKDKEETAYSLKPFTYASADTKVLFSLDEDFLISMIIGNAYPPETMQSVVTKSFISYRH